MKKTALILVAIVGLLFAQGSLYPPEIVELSKRLSHNIVAIGMAQHPHLMAAEKLADVDATRKLAQFYGQRINSIMQSVITATGDNISINLSDTTQTATSHFVKGAVVVKTTKEKTPNGYLVFVMKAITPNEAVVEVVRQADKQMRTQPAAVQQHFETEVRSNVVRNAQAAFDQLHEFMGTGDRQRETERIRELKN